MSSIYRCRLPILLVALSAVPAAVSAQDQPITVQQTPTIPDDFSLPPGRGEATPPPAQASPVVQAVPEETPPEAAAPVRERSRTPAPVNNPAPAPRAVAPSEAPRPSANVVPPPASRATPSAAGGEVAAPLAEPVPDESRPLPEAELVEEDPSGDFNWALVGLLITVAALLALVLFLRRQKIHTVPVQVEPMSPAALPIAEPIAPEAEPAPPPAPSAPAPGKDDGLVHARMPQSGLVTTNLAAKRCAQQAAPPVRPKRVIRPPGVTTRISFDGF